MEGVYFTVACISVNKPSQLQGRQDAWFAVIGNNKEESNSFHLNLIII